MKVYIFTLIAISTVAIVGCDNNDKKETPPPASHFGHELELTGNIKDLSEKPFVEYNLPEEGHRPRQCTTGPRLSINLEQYCRQLQLKSLNNDCDRRERKRRFRLECQGVAWEPQVTEQELYEAPGAHITCYASDPSEDGLEGKRLNPAQYENMEHFTDHVSAIKYGDFIAFIFMDLTDGLFRVKIRAFDEGSGRLIAEQEKTWKDRMPEEMELESLPGRVRVNCTPSIR